MMAALDMDEERGRSGRGDRADAYAVKSEEGMGEKDGRDDASPTYLEKKKHAIVLLHFIFHISFYVGAASKIFPVRQAEIRLWRID